MSCQFIFERLNRVPTLHPAQLAWTNIASWCQVGGFCSDRFRQLWRFGLVNHHLNCPGIAMACMFASLNHTVAIQIPIAV
jgi:hypothetical protein